jgi:hypothetical protein
MAEGCGRHVCLVVANNMEAQPEESKEQSMLVSSKRAHNLLTCVVSTNKDLLVKRSDRSRTDPWTVYALITLIGTTRPLLASLGQ